MQEKCSKKVLPCILCMVLIVAMALFTTGCNGSAGKASPSAGGQKVADGSVVGEGSKEFGLTVEDKDGAQTQLEIHTDKDTVGDALSELGLIIGKKSEYGLYVETVNGVTADYDKDGVYWAFYVNGEYAQAGVDSTEITEGDSYSFKME